jgi:DNA-binding IclR family transcriptional regulator
LADIKREESGEYLVSTYNPTSVIKCIDILEKFIFVRNAWGTREIARAVGITKSSAHRILQTLRNKDFLAFEEKTEKYIIGPVLLRMASVLRKKIGLVAIAEPILRKYVEITNETMFLFSYSKGKLTFDLAEGSSHNLRFDPDLGVPYDLHVGAAAKVVLAYLPADKAEEFYQRFEKEKICDTRKLKREVRRTQSKGYSTSFGERVKGIVGFGSPIFDASGAFVGGVGLAMPEVRYERGKEKEFGDLVRKCAKEISNVTGSNS